jgi:hypothetical protein
MTRGEANRSRRTAWLVFAILFCAYAYFFQGGGWNPNSRLDLTRALVERQTIRIDAYRGNTADWARRDGHFYTNKAPGLSFASAPFFGVASAAARAVDTDDPERSLRVAAYLTNLAVNALPSALLGVLLMQVLGRLGVESPIQRAWLAIAFGLGTLVFPYATAYYGHNLAAMLGFVAFAALLEARERADPRGASAMAGMAAGAAVAVESSALLVAAVLGASLLTRAHRSRVLPGYVIGGLPVALLLGAYHWSAFGHPLDTGLDYWNPGIAVSRDGGLFGAPTLSRLYGLVLSPERGLLFTSPLLALAPFGWASLRRRSAYAGWVCAAVPLAFLALLSCFYAWEGGWAAGSRYMIPCLPFLFVPVAFAAAQLPRIAAALAGLSAVIMLSITAVAVEVPAKAAIPLLDFTLPHLARGDVAVNPQGLDDARPGPGYRNLRAPQNAHSFNLGERLFPHHVASLAPLLIVQAALAFQLVRVGRRLRGS